MIGYITISPFNVITITKDPAYRERNIGLWARVGRELGVLPSLQEGMISKALLLLQKASAAQPENDKSVNIDMTRRLVYSGAINICVVIF